MVGRALRLTAGAILVIGLASAVGIYAVSTAGVEGYQPEETKQYLAGAASDEPGARWRERPRSALR
jgi:hypothetical protein